MRTDIATGLFAAFAALALCACQPDPADAPPVGESAQVRNDGAPAAAPAPLLSDAARQADFRLAVADARSNLEHAWATCTADDAGCRERALAAYDAAMAEAGRSHGLSLDDVIELLPPAPAGSASAPLVQLAGSRG
jgi:hypothetical protein